MNEAKTVFKGRSDKGKEIIIRYPAKKDLKAMREYINTLSQERTYITFQGEQLSLEEEKKFLDSHLEKISKNLAVLLLVFHEGKLIGNSGIDLKERVEKHIGVFGITIAKGFRGEGIGVKLMELVISEAEKNLPNLEIITLGVFASNDVAKEMYKKFGFIEYGNLSKGLKLENGYVDHIYMHKTTK
ncbi:GNAT family N-acetyltransferase [Candidatus Daviesbacteria bacterium]|nr:GNAT family N-acetyltransferase [Candidatus Daviesbacteria bacterium]